METKQVSAPQEKEILSFSAIVEEAVTRDASKELTPAVQLDESQQLR